MICRRRDQESNNNHKNVASLELFSSIFKICIIRYSFQIDFPAEHSEGTTPIINEIVSYILTFICLFKIFLLIALNYFHQVIMRQITAVEFEKN